MAEAEVGAASVAGRRAIYLVNLIGELFKLPAVPITHVVDNSALPPLTENVGVSKKTEHFRRWQHFCRYLVTHGYVYIHLCKTYEQLANALTKVENLSAFVDFQKVVFNIEHKA